MVIASWGIYILESAVQPDKFASIPQAMWWAVVSLTTVGYGDVVPITPMGKVFTGIIALVGIGMAALPAGILASGFSSEMRRRENAYNRALNRVMADGVVTEHELEELEKLREVLDLSEEEAQSLYLDAQRTWLRLAKCPHCGKSKFD
jgi:voltage-gated potassium channel